MWDGLASTDELRIAWKFAVRTVGHSDRPFQEVRGPAGAMVASAMRLGWSVPGHAAFLAKSGGIINLLDTCPAVLRLHALDDLRRLEAAQSSLAQKIDGPPDLEPLFEFIAINTCKCRQLGAL